MRQRFLRLGFVTVQYRGEHGTDGFRVRFHWFFGRGRGWGLHGRNTRLGFQLTDTGLQLLTLLDFLVQALTRHHRVRVFLALGGGFFLHVRVGTIVLDFRLVLSFRLGFDLGINLGIGFHFGLGLGLGYVVVGRDELVPFINAAQVEFVAPGGVATEQIGATVVSKQVLFCGHYLFPSLRLLFCFACLSAMCEAI